MEQSQQIFGFHLCLSLSILHKDTDENVTHSTTTLATRWNRYQGPPSPGVLGMDGSTDSVWFVSVLFQLGMCGNKTVSHKTPKWQQIQIRWAPSFTWPWYLAAKLFLSLSVLPSMTSHDIERKQVSIRDLIMDKVFRASKQSKSWLYYLQPTCTRRFVVIQLLVECFGRPQLHGADEADHHDGIRLQRRASVWLQPRSWAHHYDFLGSCSLRPSPRPGGCQWRSSSPEWFVLLSRIGLLELKTKVETLMISFGHFHN